MNRLLLVLFFLLTACTTTPKRPLPPNTKIVAPIAINPDKQTCKYLETVLVSDWWAGDYNKVQDDISYHATTQGANAYRIIRLWGQRRVTDAELYYCPENYLTKFKSRNYN